MAEHTHTHPKNRAWLATVVQLYKDSLWHMETRFRRGGAVPEGRDGVKRCYTYQLNASSLNPCAASACYGA